MFKSIDWNHKVKEMTCFSLNQIPPFHAVFVKFPKWFMLKKKKLFFNTFRSPCGSLAAVFDSTGRIHSSRHAFQILRSHVSDVYTYYAASSMLCLDRDLQCLSYNMFIQSRLPVSHLTRQTNIRFFLQHIRTHDRLASYYPRCGIVMMYTFVQYVT